ncbi:MAG: T9SS type A sorting domain-containing protein [Chitinophagales bacterium]|nr:T9SS type A sorting domain-containing protein [Chitinophagales bacterium]
MKRIIIASIVCLYFTAQAQNLQWAFTTGPVPTGLVNKIQAFTVTNDASENVLIGGCFRGLVDFAPGADSVGIYPAGQYSTAYILKLTPSGKYIDMKMYGLSGNSSSITSALKYDQAGNLYISGFFAGQNLDFDPDSNSTHFVSATGSGNNAFLMKWDKDDHFVWVKTWRYGADAGGRNGTLEEGPRMSLDNTGHIYMAGHFTGEIDLNPDIETYIINATQTDGYISKFDTDGNYLWGRQIQSAPSSNVTNNYVLVRSVSANDDYVYVSGLFFGKVDFNPDSTKENFLRSTSRTGFILKLDANGNFVSVKKLGMENGHYLINNNSINAVLTDNSDNVYFSGEFSDSLNFEGQKLISKGGTDIVIGKLNKNGDLEWIKTAGTSYGPEYGYRLVFDESNNLIASGVFHGTVFWGNHSITSNGDLDIFITKIDKNGNIKWLKNIGGPDRYELILGMSAKGNNLYSVGRMIRSVNFDPNGYYYLTAGSDNTYFPWIFIQKMSTDLASSFRDGNKLENVFFYPNPVQDQFTVDITKTDIHQATISIYNIQGQKVIEELAKQSITHLNTATLSPGIYLVKVQAGERFAIHKMIVK